MRDRVLTVTGVVVTTALAWFYLVRDARAMQAMAAEAQMHAAMGMDMQMYDASAWLGLFIMWTVMMVGMMLPSATPVIMLVLGVYRRRADPRARLAAAAFVGGYFVAWGGFSALAAGAQVALHQASVLSPDMRISSAVLSGGVLFAVGLYQWLPLKDACLSHCQSPLGFLSQHWREGAGGALTLGVRHGLFCVGCCWLLMVLLFVVGVMNLLWVAALSALVLLEKLIPGRALSRTAGVAAAVWGCYLLVAS